MKKLTNLNFKKLRNAEAGQFVKRTYDDIIASKIDLTQDPRVQRCLAAMLSDSDGFVANLFTSKKRIETEQLLELDIIRDRCFSALNAQLNVYSFTQNDTAIQDAYRALNQIFSVYSGLPIMNYEAETIAIVSLLQDLQKPENAPHVLALKLQDLISKLDDANKAFTKLFSNRDIAEAKKEAQDTKAARSSMFNNYNNCAEYIASMSTDDLNPKVGFYTDLLEIINVVRKYYADLLASREGRNKKEEENK